jgi:F0F1-type ATP synthase assembly protein I
MSENRTEDAKRPPGRRFRSGKERSADKAAAVVRRERLRIEAQRARDQRDVERIEAKQEKRRLRNQARDEARTGDARDKGEARQTDLLTQAAALIATIVAGQGMWQFLDRILGDVHWSLRVLMFAFLEIAVITSAIRAKRNIRKHLSAGIDGKAVWVLTSASAALATMEARSLPEAVFRLVAPLVAAWLWERGMAIERHRLRGTSGIHWRITPERLLVRLGLAEATDRTAGQVDAHRRITKVALAAKHLQQLRTANASERKQRKAVAKLDQRLEEAVAHTGLARDESMKWALLDQVGTLGGAESLCDLLEAAAGPWAELDHPLVTGASKHREAAKLADAMREWTDTLNRQRDPEVSAAVTSMAAYIAHLEGRPAPEIETANETPRPVDDQVDVEVSPHAIDELIEQLRGEPQPDADETGDETADETRATAAMWRYWQQAVEVERRIPTGAELAEAGKCTPQYGARKAKQWGDAMDGRKRRALRAGKKAEA